MKVIATGTPSFVPTILDNNGVKDWMEWSSSFDNILNRPRTLAQCNDEASVVVVYDLIDMLYKLEAEMEKITAEVKAIIDAKSRKHLEELNGFRDATWPNVDINIAIQEVIADMKSLTSDESDQVIQGCN